MTTRQDIKRKIQKLITEEVKNNTITIDDAIDIVDHIHRQCLQARALEKKHTSQIE